jgi:hypothetical protein
MSGTNPLLSAINKPNKFNSPDAYDRYIDNYNYLINAPSVVNDNKSKLSEVNTKFAELINGVSVNVFDKYLTTDAYDNILSDINTSPHNELLRSNIMSEIQHKKIYNLNPLISELNKTGPARGVITDIKALKNYDNSRILNVEKRNYKEADSKDKYIIYGNGGCLAYSPYDRVKPFINGKHIDESYKQVSFEPCDAKNTNQLFVMNNIATIDNYNNYVSTLSPPMQTLSTDSGVASSLNYYLVNPASSPGMCLNFNDSGLSVQPCNMSLNQKYSTINHHV